VRRRCRQWKSVCRGWAPCQRALSHWVRWALGAPGSSLQLLSEAVGALTVVNRPTPPSSAAVLTQLSGSSLGFTAPASPCSTGSFGFR
jgi:hypothetical protein